MSAPKTVYYDRQLVDEDTHQSIMLCKAVLEKQDSPATTKIACHARIVALLDKLPQIRLFDRTIATQNTSDLPDCAPKMRQLLMDRCMAYFNLACAFHRDGNVQNAASNYQRSTTLGETLLQTVLAPRDEPEKDAELRFEVHSNTLTILLVALRSWAEVERAIGRVTSAQRIEARVAALEPEP
ncbi:hypothetical protein IWW56_000979 [Coemansia sp. RSA 2131]|nr:hypothetical protein IWW56_000979 [Coemansia sp. RSA 2131]